MREAEPGRTAFPQPGQPIHSASHYSLTQCWLVRLSLVEKHRTQVQYAYPLPTLKLGTGSQERSLLTQQSAPHSTSTGYQYTSWLTWCTTLAVGNTWLSHEPQGFLKQLPLLLVTGATSFQLVVWSLTSEGRHFFINVLQATERKFILWIFATLKKTRFLLIKWHFSGIFDLLTYVSSPFPDLTWRTHFIFYKSGKGKKMCPTASYFKDFFHRDIDQEFTIQGWIICQCLYKNMLLTWEEETLKRGIYLSEKSFHFHWWKPKNRRFNIFSVVS